MDKNILRPIVVSQECHLKIKMIASLEGQTMKEWVEWVTMKAYEAAMINRKRPHVLGT